MGNADAASQNHILRSARNSFFDHILKRPISKPQSIRYDDTIAEPISSEPVAMSNKRLRLFSRKTSDISDAESSNRMPLIVRFYDPAVKAHDAHGRTLEDFLDWEDYMLERSHNYIQILFPLPEGSPFNIEAPIITREVFDAFHARAELRNGIRMSFNRLLEFYGFEIVNGSSTQKESESANGAKVEVERQTEVTQAQQPAEAVATDAGIATPPSEIDQTVATGQLSSGDQNPVSATKQVIAPAVDEFSHYAQPQQITTTTEAASELQPDGGISKVEETSEAKEKVGGAAEQEQETAALPRPPKKAPNLLGDILIVRAEHWQKAFKNWAIRFDHNHLRITRILRSLRVLGLEEECEAFYSALKEVFNDPAIYINERSMLYWRKAVRAPLHIAPDGEQIGWLRRLESQQEAAQQSPKEAPV